MAANQNTVFHGKTKHTSYLIGIREGRYPEQLYYGRRLCDDQEYPALYEKTATGYGNSNVVPGNKKLTLDNLCLEYSGSGTGDYRHLPLTLVLEEEEYSNDFCYFEHVWYDGIYKETGWTKMPYSRKAENDPRVSTLDITLKDSVYPVYLHLIYTFFYECDVITRRVKLENCGKRNIRIEKIMSMMLDLPEHDYQLHTFDGLWIRERQETIRKLTTGLYVNDSTTGGSSNRHNPFIMLTQTDTTEDTGSCYGFHLIYSGNHYEAVEVSGFGKTRVMSGLNPWQFSWELSGGSAFYTPEAALSYSYEGKSRLSEQFHQFVNRHIIPPQWQGKERPVLINNWEATYFDFNGEKLLKLAGEAGALGIEMLVLDDGWFGRREDDSSSLGDWIVNEEKLGMSLGDLAAKVKTQGLSFGLWFEPEMISENSDLYQKHPHWAVTIPQRNAYIGRNQHVLDLTRPEVITYLAEAIAKVLNSAPIDYVKWDMNRHISDAYSRQPGFRQGEFFHRYMLGLYELMETLVSRFPHILFEGCSAGGNRFDLGILFYMPQIWTSDNTDAHQRTIIQNGTAYGYPLSTMTAHVSAVPNHQTLRSVSLETRFGVACFGVLGYELDITALPEDEKQQVKKQIAFYKQYRRLFQFGSFKRLGSDENHVVWQVLAEDRRQAAVLYYQKLAIANPGSDILKLSGLLPDKRYSVTVRSEAGEMSREAYQAYGDLLMYAGIKLAQTFTGNGIDETTRMMGDFSTRIYLIEMMED